MDSTQRETPDSVVQLLVPDVQHCAQFKRHRTPTVFKTHHLPRPEYKRVINIVRDGRDVLCSYRHFNDAFGQSYTFDQMIESNRGMPFGSWQQHVQDWLENPHDADVLLVRYEDLKTSGTETLAEIAAFLDLQADEDQLHQLIAGTSVKKMQRREKRFGWDNDRWPTDVPFVRRGIAGGYLDEMTADEICLFEKQASGALEALGYPLNVAEDSSRDSRAA